MQIFLCSINFDYEHPSSQSKGRKHNCCYLT